MKANTSAHEKQVLHGVSLDEAASRFALMDPPATRDTPLFILGKSLALSSLRACTAREFVRAVSADSVIESVAEEKARVEAIESCISIGGHSKALALALKKGEYREVIAAESSTQDGPEADIRSLMNALELFRRVFPSELAGQPVAVDRPCLLSPPPSPSRRRSEDLDFKLRFALGAPVFDCIDETEDSSDSEELDQALEDARDRVVDLLMGSQSLLRRRLLGLASDAE